uniref:AUDH_Cupin domain-containing protein n=2 Tax=Caenorhabditis tropicalis TaxID=1561998 RepID=A0A1I7UDF4_9PELO
MTAKIILFVLELAIMWNMVQTDHDEIEKAEAMNSMAGLKYTIDHTWDGLPLAHEAIKIDMKWHFERLVGRPHKRVVKISFDAPFFDDPEPMDPPGITPQLWDFEVLEFFFANDRGQYLEVEIGPHGHWLCLLFDGVRHPINNGEELELEVRNKWVGNRWVGEVEIPLAYFPAKVSKFNAYHIHGNDTERVYAALNPVTDGTYSEPDFHRLDFFQRINMRRIVPEGYGDRPFADFKYGDLWAGHY